MPAPEKNQFAAKAKDELIAFPVIIRGTEKERKKWRKAAAGGKFNDWGRAALNAKAEKVSN